MRHHLAITRLFPIIAGTLACAASASADDLSPLSDDFSTDTRANWLTRAATEGVADQLERWAINPADAPGKMVMMPHTSTWYEGYRAAQIYKNVSGDFAITTSVKVSNRAGTGVPSSQFSLAGIMLRVAPNPTSSPENYVFLSLGHGTGGAAQFEVKTTMDGTSRLVLSQAETLTAQLQVARVGQQIITLYKRPADADWVVHRVYDASALDPYLDHTLGSGTLQAGLVTYTDWLKASTFQTDYHNANALTNADNGASSAPVQPFNPDLVATFDYVNFARVNLPGGFAPGASSADYLAVLGDNAVPTPGAAGLAAIASLTVLARRRRK